MGLNVPEILLSGHHANIEKWRRRESIERTFKKRPDLIENATLNEEDKMILKEIIDELSKS
jgi:tRNA (guanine37-N1)-methyltransferase